MVLLDEEPPLPLGFLELLEALHLPWAVDFIFRVWGTFVIGLAALLPVLLWLQLYKLIWAVANEFCWVGGSWGGWC
jgi:hypothetical protein